MDPPPHQTEAQVVWIDVQCFADILKRIGPCVIPSRDPGFSFRKEPAGSVGASAIIFLKAFDRVSQNCEHKFLFRIEMRLVAIELEVLT